MSEKHINTGGGPKTFSNVVICTKVDVTTSVICSNFKYINEENAVYDTNIVAGLTGFSY